MALVRGTPWSPMGKTNCNAAAVLNRGTRHPQPDQVLLLTGAADAMLEIRDRRERLVLANLRRIQGHESFKIIHSPTGCDHAVNGWRAACGLGCIHATAGF